MSDDATSNTAPSRRLDRWLWFARLVKSRSLASRLCAAGAVMVNGAVIGKARHGVRVGDTIGLPQGAFHRTVEVRALGTRRGPSAEARQLYEETAAPMRLSERAAAWVPLLDDAGPAREAET